MTPFAGAEGMVSDVTTFFSYCSAAMEAYRTLGDVVKGADAFLKEQGGEDSRPPRWFIRAQLAFIRYTDCM